MIGCHVYFRGRWCVVVLNVHAPREENAIFQKSFYEESGQVFDYISK